MATTLPLKAFWSRENLLLSSPSQVTTFTGLSFTFPVPLLFFSPLDLLVTIWLYFFVVLFLPILRLCYEQVQIQCYYIPLASFTYQFSDSFMFRHILFALKSILSDINSHLSFLLLVGLVYLTCLFPSFLVLTFVELREYLFLFCRLKIH